MINLNWDYLALITTWNMSQNFITFYRVITGTITNRSKFKSYNLLSLVIQVQIDTSRFGVKCPDLIGDAGGQYMFFLYLFYRPRLSKVSQSVSNKSYLILSYAQ